MRPSLYLIVTTSLLLSTQVTAGLAATQNAASPTLPAAAPDPQASEPRLPPDAPVPKTATHDAALRWTQIPVGDHDHGDALLARLPTDAQWLADQIMSSWHRGGAEQSVFDAPAAGGRANAGVLHFETTVCGDSTRFLIEWRVAGRPARPLTECSTIGSLSPDGRFAVLESQVVDLAQWIAYPMSSAIPEQGYPLAWSSDGNRIAVEGGTGIVILDLTGMRAPSRARKHH